MRVTHICLLSLLLAALYTSTFAAEDDTGYISKLPGSRSITVSGKITWKGYGVKRARVYAYDYNKFGGNVRLGSAYTDHYGSYKIIITPKHNKLDKYPDIFIQVLYKAKTKSSPVKKDVRRDVTINLAL